MTCLLNILPTGFYSQEHTVPSLGVYLQPGTVPSLGVCPFPRMFDLGTIPVPLIDFELLWLVCCCLN